jgi:hypothetical protein
MESCEARGGALGVGLGVGLAGALPLVFGVDAARSLAWAALWAVPAGVLVARAGSRVAAPLALGAPLAALLVLRDFPRPLGALGAVLGLAALGVALGRATSAAARWRVAGLALACAALLAGLPAGGGLAAGAPWSAPVTARLLDLSPVVLAEEAAGFDWLRHPAVYEPAGADAIGPDLRVARGMLAGWVLLVVGCALAGVACKLRGAPEE